jgi:predicted RNase H-like HicB family nuclease
MADDNRPQYSYFVSWSPEDREFAVSFIELPTLSGLGSTIGDAIQELHEALDGWLEIAAENNYPLPSAIQKNTPLVVIDRSHWGVEEAVVTELASVLPSELRIGEKSDSDTTADVHTAVAHAA